MTTNPVKNQIVKGREINKKTVGGNFMWTECPNCHQYRWAVMLKGQPKAKRCRCYMTGRKLTFSETHCKNLSLSKLGDKNPQKQLMGEKNVNWKGGRATRSDGYVMVYLDSADFYHSMCTKQHYVMEHRLVMAHSLSRCLLQWETVHHKNGIRSDNRIENLELFPEPHKHNGISNMQSYIKKLESKVRKLERALEA